MPKSMAGCEALFTWLRLNLGRSALAPLTGTDWKALAAAAHIVELYAYGRGDGALCAFRDVVLEMQPKTRELAFHAIAHVMEWPDRSRVWELAGLPPYAAWTRCKGEA